MISTLLNANMDLVYRGRILPITSLCPEKTFTGIFCTKDVRYSK